MAAAFIENAIFPTDISNGSVGGPTFSTFVQGVQSGYEQRIPVWPYGRHFYEVQYGVKTALQSQNLLYFFHSMLGKTYGFRYYDPMDNRSCDITDEPAADDQVLIASAIGGETTQQLFKSYNTGGQITNRPITKPISGTVLLEINSVPQVETTNFTVDYTTGILTFVSPSSLTASDLVTCGFKYHVPCRFDIDRLPMSLQGPLISNTRIPIIEIRPGN